MSPFSAQKETGDGHNILEEYRGYILDGGGLDGAGANGHAGGHIRLDPARKEILVEVDRAATLNNVPGTGTLDQKLTAILNGASKVFSNADRGAGIFMYYLFDEVNLQITPDMLTGLKILDELEKSRDTAAARTADVKNLKTDFLHLLLVDSGIGDAGVTSAEVTNRDKRGSYLSTSEAHGIYNTMQGITSVSEAFMCVVAHELNHLLIAPAKPNAIWDQNEHLLGAQFSSDLMYNPNGTSRQLATVNFSATTQEEIITGATNPGLNP